MTAPHPMPWVENAPRPHQCCCVMTVSVGVDGTLLGPGRCRALVSADQPFCIDCEDRHPGFAEAGASVTAVL